MQGKVMFSRVRMEKSQQIIKALWKENLIKIFDIAIIAH